MLDESALYAVLGFDVRVFDIAQPHDRIIQRLSDALGLVRDHDPRRFERMKSDLSQILVRNEPGTQHWVLSNTCALELDEVMGRSSVILALSIVHEATHARLVRAGIYPSQRRLERIERRCLIEERSFAVALQRAGFSGAERMLEWLDARIDPPSSDLGEAVHSR